MADPGMRDQTVAFGVASVFHGLASIAERAASAGRVDVAMTAIQTGDILGDMFAELLTPEQSALVLELKDVSAEELQERVRLAAVAAGEMEDGE